MKPTRHNALLLFVLALLALVAVILLSGCAPTSRPIPQGTVATKTVVPKAATAKPAATVSTCDAVREAILTGTQAEIDKAMGALVKDKTADATAREYARYYLGRDKKNPQMREADVSLIQLSCTTS